MPKSNDGDAGLEFFRLNRPEYLPAPELLVSQLAWSLRSRERSASPNEDIGKLVYRMFKRAPGSDIRETCPEEGTEDWKQIARYLGEKFMLNNARDSDAAVQAMLDDLAGSAARQAKAKPVVPLFLETALMQNAQGVLNRENPPNFALILEQMFYLGGGRTLAENDGSKGVALLLLEAFSRLKNEENSDWLGEAVEQVAPEDLLEIAEEVREHPTDARIPQTEPPTWILNRETPYAWFARSWCNLCLNRWNEKMPAARWIKWAECVLRTAIGMGYLFEMRFYYSLVKSLLSDEDPGDIVESVITSRIPLLKWDTGWRVSTRDVHGQLKQLCQRGVESRKLIEKWARTSDNGFPSPSSAARDENGLQCWIVSARKWCTDHSEAQEGIQEAISAPYTGPAKNMFETIYYALLQRGSHGEVRDPHSLLAKRGNRYTIVDPAQEWFVVVASLASRFPTHSCRLANVSSDLASIGLRPGYTTIVGYLEKSGLARSSHDADEAIVVVSAF